MNRFDDRSLDMGMTVLKRFATNSYPVLPFHVKRTNAYPYFTVHHFLEGEGAFILDGKHYSLKEGSTFFIPPHVSHAYYTVSNNKCKLNFCEMSLGYLEPMMINLFKDCRPVLDGSKSKEINKCICDICKKTDDKYIVSEKIYKLLITIKRIYDGYRNYDDENQSFKELVEKITKDLGGRILVSDIAKKSGYSISLFTKKFKSIYGVNPKEYFLQKKFDKAVYLLEKTDLSVEAISKELDFFDKSHFIRFFLSKSGETPTEFRKSYLTYVMLASD